MNIEKLSRIIESHYKHHNVPLRLCRYEIINNWDRVIFDLNLKKGAKLNDVYARAIDIQKALQLSIFQPYEDAAGIHLAVSEQQIKENSLLKMLECSGFYTNRMWIPIPLGYDMRCEMVYADLGKFPHALYGGATRSGKTVGLQCLISGIAYLQSTHRVNLIIIDTGASGLDLFNPLPHLSYPVVKDHDVAIIVILKLKSEMDRRKSLAESELRGIPAIVCVIDEYINLISKIEDKEEQDVFLSTISSLLRHGRHAKIHIILATQEAEKHDMLINRNNLTARIAFACSDFYSSKAILGIGGAERLSGNGAMLFKSPELIKPIYLQGAFMAPNDIRQLVVRICSKSHDQNTKFVIPAVEKSQFLLTEPEILNSATLKNDNHSELIKIIMWTFGQTDISALQIQKHFHMGNRASGLLEKLSSMDLVAEKFANQPRVVIPTCLEEIPTDVIELLLANGVTEDDIIAAFQSRG